MTENLSVIFALKVLVQRIEYLSHTKISYNFIFINYECGSVYVTGDMKSKYIKDTKMQDI